MSVSVNELLSQIQSANLLPREQLQAAYESLPKDSPRDARALAVELTSRGLLTAYQAERLLDGMGDTLVLGSYLVLDRLGQGGMGVVLLGEHRRMRRRVAIKLLSQKLLEDRDAGQRFLREVVAAGMLEHPNVVAAFDAGEVRGQLYFVMEYVEGTDLSTLVKRSGPLEIGQAVSAILQAARGLAFAHCQGIIHRDVKPANILLDAQGVAKLLDMGLARIVGDAGSGADLTGTGTVMGTVDYMAPEQAISVKDADARSDIYSLGITLWYLLTGRPAYVAEGLLARMLAHREAPIPSLCAARPEAPPALGAIFQKMVQKAPADRFQTMQEVVTACERFLRGESVGLVEPDASEEEFNAFLTGLTSNTHPAAGGAKRTPRVAGDEPTIVQVSAASETRRKSSKSDTAVIPGSRWAISWRDPRLLAVCLVVVVGFGAWAFMRQRFSKASGTGGAVAITPKLPESTKAEIKGPHYALAFDGLNDHVDIPTLNMDWGEPLTWEAVVTYEGEQDAGRGVILSDCGPIIGSLYRHESGTWNFASYNSKGWREFTGSTVWSGTPTHLAMAWDGQDAKLYVDGTPVTFEINNGPDIGTQETATGMTIGGQRFANGWANSFFKGTIHEIRISKGQRYERLFTPKSPMAADASTIALYRCQEGSGATIKSAVGTGLDGLIVGAKWVREQSSGGYSPVERISPQGKEQRFALELNGKDQLVELPVFTHPKDEPLTMEAWIEPAGHYQDIAPVLFLTHGNGVEHCLRLDRSSQGHIVCFYRHEEPNFYFEGAVDPVPFEPVHLAGVWLGPQRVRIYINGRAEPKPPPTGNGWTTYKFASRSSIGYWNTANDELFYRGLVDEIRVSRGARYEENFVPARRFTPDETTLALYHCDEGSGETLIDSSSHKRDGKVRGAHWAREFSSDSIAPAKP